MSIIARDTGSNSLKISMIYLAEVLNRLSFPVFFAKSWLGRYWNYPTSRCLGFEIDRIQNQVVSQIH
jgi:hypothetical protein